MTAMGTERPVVMAKRVAGKDECNCEGGKSDGDGKIEGNYEEEGDGEQQ